jgi:outer membrane biosynthesis protein TonB
MSMKDSDLRLVSGSLTIVITMSLFGSVVYFTRSAEAHRPPLTDNMEAIEASIAFTKTPKKQPQKKMREPDPVEKPQGVQHDETQKPVEKKPEEKKKPPKDDPKDPFKNFKHASDDDDQPVGKPTTDPGDFNGNERGWASETKGHPYFQKFAQDIHDNFSLPTISQVNGSPVGCFHLTPDGKIVDTQFESNNGGADLERAAKDAIDAVKKLRNANPIPVPTELLGSIHRWLCFRFNPNAAH